MEGGNATETPTRAPQVQVLVEVVAKAEVEEGTENESIRSI